MAFAETTGTEAIGTTEHSLASDTSYDTGDAQTDDCMCQLWLDTSDMVAGDQLQIRLYEKVRSGDSQQVAHEWILNGARGKEWTSPVFVLFHGWDWTLDALAGTITVNWSIRKVT